MVIKLISESQEAKRSLEEGKGREWGRERSRSPLGEILAVSSNCYQGLTCPGHRRASPEVQARIPVSLPASLTITTKTKELQSETHRTTSSSSSSSPPQLPLLHQMLTDNPLMGAAMQQMMSSPSSPSLPGLPSSADLLQQAHALQLLAQLQSVLLVNRQDPPQVRAGRLSQSSVAGNLAALLITIHVMTRQSPTS